jgi:hypothetical protein
VEAVDSHRERMKPPFDLVSVGVVEPTAQSESRVSSQVAEAIDQKHCP